MLEEIHRPCSIGGETRVTSSLLGIEAVHQETLCVVNKLWLAAPVRNAPRRVETYCWLGAFATLGSDDDHTVGSTRTVDSGCRCVLQYVDGSDVIGVDFADTTIRDNAIDDEQRSVVSLLSSRRILRDHVLTTQSHGRRVVTSSAACRRVVQTSYLA